MLILTVMEHYFTGMSSAVFLLVISTLGLCVIAELDQKSLNRLRASNYFTRVALNVSRPTIVLEYCALVKGLIFFY